MTDNEYLIEKLNELHIAATPGNLDTAELKEEGMFECPLCDGSGAVYGEQYINYDNDTVNVLFSGLGNGQLHNRDWYKAITYEWPYIYNYIMTLKKENENAK